MGLIYLFFWPEVIHLRRRALPQPPGHVAGLAERPQNVAAENLVHVGLGITAAQQLLGEPGYEETSSRPSGQSVMPSTLIMGSTSSVVRASSRVDLRRAL